MDDNESTQLLQQARDAKRFARARYSKFPVGAALRLRDGSIVTAANVESASYGLTCCAERIAIFKALTSSDESIVALAVSCGENPSTLPERECMPCGACRQVMAEFMAEDTPIVVDGRDTFTLGTLLPRAFLLPTNGKRSEKH